VIPILFDQSSSTGARQAALERATRLPLRDVAGGPIDPPATTVALACDSWRLYVRFDCTSEPPLRILARETNSPVYEDECVEFFWAGSGAPEEYVEMVVNPLGARYGARVRNPDASRATWELTPGVLPEGFSAVVEGEPRGVSPDAWRRWSCLLSVPWESLPPTGFLPEPGQVLRGNLFRIARGRQQRFEALSPTGRGSPADFHVPFRFATFAVRWE
jgi:hypothetical protein